MSSKITWKKILGTLVTLIEHGDVEGRATAIAELTRMAKLADGYVTSSKERCHGAMVADAVMNMQRGKRKSHR